MENMHTFWEIMSIVFTWTNLKFHLLHLYVAIRLSVHECNQAWKITWWFRCIDESGYALECGGWSEVIVELIELMKRILVSSDLSFTPNSNFVISAFLCNGSFPVVCISISCSYRSKDYMNLPMTECAIFLWCVSVELPLVLYDSVYEGLEWRRCERNYVKVVSHFQQMWTEMMVKSVLIHFPLEALLLWEISPTHNSIS